ncbi:acetate/propionate family kinase [Chelatococcus sambhunathii]|uniref:acetate/propionate family kinase n=1 Tax=Chelatococcus sambhunathii TaxID=363953 RepID=UPI00285286EC|nr:acetate/propionate family kinase [Chelatococcus sambhunathii]
MPTAGLGAVETRDEGLLVTFNAGSSTVKIGLFALETAGPRRVGKGLIDFRRKPLTFHLVEGPEAFDVALESEAGEELDEVLSEAFARLGDHFDLARVTAVGHRVVHGGDVFAGAVRVDDRTLGEMERLSALAPLHQPQALRLIRAIARLRPELPQTASFDTAFHRTNDPIARRFAIPRELHDAGIKRYGFHGLSYKSVAGELRRREPELAAKKVVVAHLGSGASLCALDEGVSRDSSMGFSTLDGVPMATRCGALDVGVALHLLGQEKRTLNEVEDILYHRSGLLGVSGISADSRELIESDRPEAREALDLFAFRIAGEIARLASTLGGLDGLVFTAGIGENQPRIRAAIARRLAWLGASLDDEANDRGAALVGAPGSRVALHVIATDEEQAIAEEAVAILDRKD